MTVYCDETFQHAVVPQAIFLARRDGKVTQLQFDILCLWCLLVDYKTRIIPAWSAEVFLHWMGTDDPKHPTPSARTIQRAVTDLCEKGWGDDSDYHVGIERPYDICFPVPTSVAPKKQTSVAPPDNGSVAPKKQISDSDSSFSDDSLFSVSQHISSPVSQLISAPVSLNNQSGQGNSEELHPADPDKLRRMNGKRLRESVSRSITQILHSSRVPSAYFEERCALLVDAFGIESVETDFAAWCGEHIGDDWSPCPPFQKYADKDVEKRLAKVFTPTADVNDPRVAELVQLTYAETNTLPPKKIVAELLLKYPFDEIKGAVIEFSGTVQSMKEKQAAAAMYHFWSDGGVGAVITARRRRKRV